MEGSQASIVRDWRWRPTLGSKEKVFRMTDLLLFAFEEDPTLIAPLGNSVEFVPSEMWL
jgi:hypothetical protein